MGISVKMSLNYVQFLLISLNFKENENLKFWGEKYMFSSACKLPNFPFTFAKTPKSIPIAKTPKSKQREWK